MNWKIGLSSKVVQDRPLEEAVQIAVHCGYTGLELFGMPSHLPPDVSLDRVRDLRRRCDDLGLRVVTLCTYVGGFAERSDRACAAELETHRRYVQIAQILECTMIRLWPDELGRTIETPRDDHFPRAAYYLRACADVGLREGTRVLLENHKALTISADLTLRLVRLIDRPNVVVSFDPGNMCLADQAYGREAVLRLGTLIQNVQVKEVARRGTATRTTGDATVGAGGTHEILLGQGDIDHQSYLRPLREIGYDGYYMAECHKPPTPDLPSDQIAAHEIQALRALLDESLPRPRGVFV